MIVSSKQTMSYYLYFGTVAVGVVLVATCRKFFNKNKALTQHATSSHTQKTLEERRQEWYESLSDERRQQLETQTKFANDLHDETMTLVGKSFDEVDELCSNNFCRFEPTKVNGNNMVYLQQIERGTRKITGVVEDDIVTEFKVHEMTFF